MKNSATKIWIHALFGTKDGLPLINETLENRLYTHIKYELDAMHNPIGIINGIENHIHILFLLNQGYALKDVIKNVKGESSHWINHNNLSEAKFSWQIGYTAYSVSESNFKKVETYIANQKLIHKKLSFKEEYKLLMKKHGLPLENR